jgi:microcin C transport system substrate-binding protein
MLRTRIVSFAVAIVVLVSFVTLAHASEPTGPITRAIAMHGTPKYAADFQHFDYVNPNAPKAGALRQGVTGSFDSLNPFIIRGKPAAGLPYIYDRLMVQSQDEPFSLYGLIAESVTVAPDRSSITFFLNQAARWHDGKPVTADDVLFSWETLRDKGRPNHRSYYKRGTGAKLDDHTVYFSFVPNSDGTIDRELPMIFALMVVLPKHYWTGKDFSATSFMPPLGSGPYKIAAVDPGRSINYELVRDYWGRDLPVNRGLYNFADLNFDYYRDDAVALQAFKAGRYDIRLENDPAKWADYDTKAVAQGRLRLDEIPHQRVEAVRAYAFNTRRPLFNDPSLRQVISDSFDFAWINRSLFRDAYKRTTSYFPNSILAASTVPDVVESKLLSTWQQDLPPEMFTQAFAFPVSDGRGAVGMRQTFLSNSEKLRAAGYKLQFGKLLTPKDQPVEFEILLNDPTDEKVALEFARNLARLGIIMKVRTVDSAQYQARLNEFDYDMAAVRWVNSLSPGNEQAIYWGSAAADQKGSRNYAGIKNNVVDSLIKFIPVTRNREQLVTAVRALDRVLLWNYYAVPLYYLGKDFVANWAGLQRPEITPINGLVIESWWRR